MYFSYGLDILDCISAYDHYQFPELASNLSNFYHEYKIIRRADAKTFYWLGCYDTDADIFDDVNAWFDENKDVIITSCVYFNVTVDHMNAYTSQMDKFTNMIRGMMAEKPRLRKWDELKSLSGVSMRDHVHWYSQGFSNPDTSLVVIDADGVKLLKALKKLMP